MTRQLKGQRVYRIVTRNEWEGIEREGMIRRSSLDIASGFMHLSASSEVLETCRRYFSAESEPMALEICAEDLGGSLRWEAVKARGGTLFPHYFGAHIPKVLIQAVHPLQTNAAGEWHW